MTTPAPFGTFFYPGPTEVRPEVLAAMARPMIPHRGAAFRALFAGLQPGLRELFGTARRVYVSTSSATGLMEAAVRAAPPGRILALVNGAFSERFAAIARACGRAHEEYRVAWGEVPDPAEVARRLCAARESGEPFAAVTVVHSETSTGALADVAAIAAAARAHGARTVVDGVTSIAGMPFAADAWGLDFALTGSQKALALPPGLAFGVASAELLAGAARAAARGLYLDLVEMERYAERDETPNTPAVSLLYALERQLGDMAREGLAARVARHAAMAAMTHAWVARWGARSDGAVRVVAPAGARAPTITAIALPAGVAAAEVVRLVAAGGFVVGTGYGKLRETTFRIGHMGDHTPDGLARCLAACDAALERVLREAGRGASDAAGRGGAPPPGK
jgi:aspartate aminotransferase-like enzyme